MDLKSLPRIGYGCASLSGIFGPVTPEESDATLRKSIEIGCTVWDTSDLYGFRNGFGHNEKVLARVLAEEGMREKVFLITKFGFNQQMVLTGSPEHARKAIDDSIERLGTIPDAWLIHRIPTDVPIKTVVEVMEEVRKAGKTKYIGLSEPSARTLREATKYGKIDFIENEYSPFCLDLERRGIMDVCKEFDIKILAFSPLGKGFLTGRYKTYEDLEADNRTIFSPRFAKEVFDKNYRIVTMVDKYARLKNCTPSQVALAWTVAQDERLIPIPGTRDAGRMQENFEALKIKFTEEELKEMREFFEENKPEGQRYPGKNNGFIDED